MSHLRWLALSTGLALFSMFFGSGNLVFPITVGQESNNQPFIASAGIILTGVIVPFLGVFGMLLYNGEIGEFFKVLGRRGIFIFSLLALALMGPFGVLARCLTVAHGAVLLLFPNVSLPMTSLILSVAIYFLAANKSKIVHRLGAVLTPFLLGSIALIAYFGLTGDSSSETTTTGLTGWNAFKNGFFQGYQTMDLLAAFFFSTFIIKHLTTIFTKGSDDKTMLKLFCKASGIGAGILSVVYLALVMLGSSYSSILNGKLPQEMLGIIALESLGSFAAPIVCVAVILACGTTAIVLASLFAEFLCEEIFKKKMGESPALAITMAIGFLVSTLDFAGIAMFLGPVLEAVYPALILLTLVNIGLKVWKFRSVKET